MPENSNLTPVKHPMVIRFGEKPTTEFKNNLDSIKVSLLNAPSMEQLRNYLVPFLEATWAEGPLDSASLPLIEKDHILRECLFGRALPTALETVRLTFLIEGISLQEVTHILRYRTASFSADCSADKWWSHKAALVPSAIQNSSEIYQRYQKLMEDAKQLYCDIIDTKEITIMDARYVLPRCFETYYFMSMSIKDAIHFINQRIDRMIQPETDNVMAYQMYMQMLARFPILYDVINIDEPSWFYIKTARTGKSTSLYVPDETNDKWEWNREDFIYGRQRSELRGTDVGARCIFDEYLEVFKEDIEFLNRSSRRSLVKEYSEQLQK